jgi:hypothetical protein
MCRNGVRRVVAIGPLRRPVVVRGGGAASVHRGRLREGDEETVCSSRAVFDRLRSVKSTNPQPQPRHPRWRRTVRSPDVLHRAPARHLRLRRIIAAATGVAILMPFLSFAFEMLALRHMTPIAFGTLMAVEPAIGVPRAARTAPEALGHPTSRHPARRPFRRRRPTRLRVPDDVALIVWRGAASQQRGRGLHDDRVVPGRIGS